MKKIILIASAFIGLFIASCKKENVALNQSTNANQSKSSNAETANINNLMHHTFKYNKEVKVYDKTNKYFVTVELKSDNDSIIKNAVEYYNGMEMVLLYDKPSIASNNDTSINNNLNIESKSNNLSNNQNVLIAEFNVVNKGNSIGFKLITKPFLRDDVYSFSISLSGSPVIFVYTCQEFYVTVRGGALSSETVTQNNNGNWELVESHGWIHPGSSWAFDQGSFAQKLLQMRGSVGTIGTVEVLYW